MNEARSFREILERKLHDSPSTLHDEVPTQVESIHTLDTLIASLLETGVNRKASPHFALSKYPRQNFQPQRPSPSASSREKVVQLSPRPGEKVTLVRQLSPRGHEAMKKLMDLGAKELKPLSLISESIIKRVYRRLALEWHPDRAPKTSGREFHALVEAQSILLNELRA